EGRVGSHRDAPAAYGLPPGHQCCRTGRADGAVIRGAWIGVRYVGRDPRRLPVTRRFTIWLGWWVFLFLVWMLLVLTQATPELVAGVVVAAIGATATDVVRRSRFVTVSLRDLLPRHPWHLATTFVSDCWLLTVALWR